MELVHGVYETGRQGESQRACQLVPNGGTFVTRDVFHVSFDPDTEPPREVVIEAVQVVHNKEWQSLAPLADTIDPDALNHLLVHSSNEIEIDFIYEGLDITITNTGNIRLRRK